MKGGKNLNSDQIEYLVLLAQQGNQQAFSQIVKLNQQKVFRYCYSMLTNHQDAEDIVQDTFIKAYNHLHRYRSEDNFFGWLVTIAHRLCLNKLRRNTLTFGLINKLTIEQHTTSEQFSSKYDEQKNEEIFFLLNKLKPKARAIVILKVIQGLSYDEISGILHDNPANLRKQFERTKKRLQKFKWKYDIESEGEINYEYKNGLRTTHR